MRVTVLAGGTGSAKLLRGLAAVLPDFSVVANVGDNVWMHGLYICPDIDIAMYTLAGVANRRLGWGVKGDTFAFMDQLGRLGGETWFSLGDRDLATHVMRTESLRRGESLTKVTEKLCGRLGVRQRVLPATDSPVQTWVETPKGAMLLQDFWVRLKGGPAVSGIEYRGAPASTATEQVREAIMTAERIVVCPANPVTSIGPILAVPGILKFLRETPARIVALSPMKGSAPFSGPAGKLLKASGGTSDSVGVATRYETFLDALVIDKGDRALAGVVSRKGIECRVSDIGMARPSDERRLARELLRV